MIKFGTRHEHKKENEEPCIQITSLCIKLLPCSHAHQTPRRDNKQENNKNVVEDKSDDGRLPGYVVITCIQNCLMINEEVTKNSKYPEQRKTLFDPVRDFQERLSKERQQDE